METPTIPEPTTTSHPAAPFAALGIAPPFVKACAAVEITTPTEIQSAMIPLVLAGRDVVGQAKTGTGKTLAFALPLLQRMDPAGGLQALCLVPTRELAQQVMQEIKRLAKFAKLRCAAVYGGQKLGPQLTALQKHPHFVVGTPGRVMDFMSRRQLDISKLPMIVLDEVDRMLDIGFRDDIRRILSHVQGPHQTIVVSATVSEEIRRLIAKHTVDPVEVNVSRDELTVDEVQQFYVTVENREKYRLLRVLLKREEPHLAIIFTNTKHAARRLAKKLFEDGFAVGEIHGDLVQRRREKVLEAFKEGKVKLLIATDLASRGIHIDDITHIFNYDIPEDPEIYVHRIGRTARMGCHGIAISFVNREEGKQITQIEMLINKEIPPRQVEGFESAAPPPDPLEAAAAAQAQAAQADPTPSRFRNPAQIVVDGQPVAAPRKTLGGRFKPSRRRRL